MKNKNLIYILIIAMILLSACKKEEVKPFGALDIDYEAVEKINNDGPTLSSDRSEFNPPMAEKTEEEKGPWATQNESEMFPYLEGDGTISEDDVPIYVKEHN